MKKRLWNEREKNFLRENYSGLLLLMTILINFYTTNLLLVILYLIVIIFRSIYKKNFGIIKTFNFFVYFVTRDLIFWTSFIFFFPSNRKKFTVELIV